MAYVLIKWSYDSNDDQGSSRVAFEARANRGFAANVLRRSKRRFLDPQMKMWLGHDPAQYVDGMNYYTMELGNPITNLDPLGLDASAGGTSSSATPPSGTTAGATTRPSSGNSTPSGPSENGGPPYSDPHGHRDDGDGPIPQQTAAAQLAMLRQAGARFSQFDGPWIWGFNECGDQAAALANWLKNRQDWNSQKIQYWIISIDNGTSATGTLHHNVVLLIPNRATDNKMPPMILDAFHGPQNFDQRGCKCKTQAEFKREYPRPITDSFWSFLFHPVPVTPGY